MGEIQSKKISETKNSIALLDAFPLTKGHTLIIPKNHHTKIQEMSEEENSDFFGLVYKILPRIDSFTGSSLVAIHNGKEAGQEIPHVHVHLIPRSLQDSAGPVHNMFSKTIKLSETEQNEIYDKLKD